MKETDSIPGPAGEKDTVNGPDFSVGAWSVWIIGCVVSLVMALLTVRVIFKCAVPVESVAGWMLAAANAAVSLATNMIALRRKGQGFVAWGTAGILLRSMAVLVIIILIKLSEMLKIEIFIAAFLASYLVFMIAETARMNVINLRSARGK